MHLWRVTVQYEVEVLTPDKDPLSAHQAALEDSAETAMASIESCVYLGEVDDAEG